MNGSTIWAQARAALDQRQAVAANTGSSALIEGQGHSLFPYTQLIRQALQSSGWLTLVAPPSRQLLTPLLAEGVDPNRLLWVHRGATLDPVWAAEQALLARRSALVICWCEQMNSLDRRRLQLAARRSGGQVLLLGGQHSAAVPGAAVTSIVGSWLPSQVH